MQLLWMALVLGVFLHDAYRASPGAWEAGIGGWMLLGIWLGPKVALAGAYAWVSQGTLSQLGTRSTHRALRRQDLATLGFAVGLTLSYAADLAFGVLTHVRTYLGDPVLIDELIVMAPVLGVMIFSWWAAYPIDRRLREASIINHLDSRRAIYPIWTRGQYILSQLRHQTALILGPLLMVYAWAEIVGWLGPAHYGWIRPAVMPWTTLGGALLIFVSAPLLIATIWDTVPLPDGELRNRLVSMCNRHGVRVRKLLLWRTADKGGGLVNAAVMGVIAPLRYILITDALLDQIEEEEVEGVMAHELAHVKKHHMFWLIVAAAGGASVLEFVVFAVADALAQSPGAGGGGGASPRIVQAASSFSAFWNSAVGAMGSHTALLGLGGSLAAVLWINAFGWVSRRIERQADAFAVGHLAQRRSASADDEADAGVDPVVDQDSALTMIQALEQVARLNHVRPTKNSWRHGSITWRQAYLRSLIGCPLNNLPIDRQMRWVKLASAAAIAVLVILAFTYGGSGS